MDTCWPQLSNWPFSWETMRRLSDRMKGIFPAITLQERHVRIHSFSPYRVNSGWIERPHVHWLYEAHIFLYGKVQYTYEGTQLVGPGSILLHRPGVRHTWQAEEPSLCFVSTFSVEPDCDIMTSPPWPVWPDVVWEVGLLLADVQSARSGWEERITSRMTTLLSRILSLSSRQVTPVRLPACASTLVSRVNNYLLQHLTEQITLEEIAVELGVSERSLIRQFREEAGETVFQRLQHIRLEQTERLLAETNLPLTDIGSQVGIRDAAYLVNWYRKQTSLTPMQFRRMMHANNTCFA